MYYNSGNRWHKGNRPKPSKTHWLWVYLKTHPCWKQLVPRHQMGGQSPDTKSFTATISYWSLKLQENRQNIWRNGLSSACFSPWFCRKNRVPSCTQVIKPGRWNQHGPGTSVFFQFTNNVNIGDLDDIPTTNYKIYSMSVRLANRLDPWWSMDIHGYPWHVTRNLYIWPGFSGADCHRKLSET